MAKGPEAFRTISEAAEELGVAQHVLRFWETKFPFIKPMKRAGGRRFYRPGDIALLATVRSLLRQEGYSIRGVQKLHREGGLKAPAGLRPAPNLDTAARTPTSASQVANPQARVRLGEALSDLLAAKARLDAVLKSEAPP